MQQARQCDYLQRITFGAATGITEQLSIGRPYGNIRKVTCISIIYFDICPGGDYIYHGQGLLCGLHTGAPLIVDNDHLHPWEKPQKECHKVFPEYYLLCVNNFDATTGRHAPQGIDQWMAYLKDGRIARQPTARGLAKARKRLRYCNLKRNERLAYDKHLRILQAWQEAVEEHTLQALRGERERIANSLRCSGIDDKLICTIVNPPELSNSKILITQS